MGRFKCDKHEQMFGTMVDEWWAAFNQDIGDWDVGRVTNFEQCLEAKYVFNQDISDWNMVSCNCSSKCLIEQSVSIMEVYL